VIMWVGNVRVKTGAVDWVGAATLDGGVVGSAALRGAAEWGGQVRLGREGEGRGSKGSVFGFGLLVAISPTGRHDPNAELRASRYAPNASDGPSWPVACVCHSQS
jgi:hypothetical protein